MNATWQEDMRGFWSARLGAGENPSLRVPSGFDPGTRMGVYRGNGLGVVVQTLQLRYPVCAAVVGVRCFRSMAREYRDWEPLTRRDLSAYGADFPGFIARRVMARPGFEGLPYLVDLARLEDAVFVSARLPAGHGLDFARFAGIPAARRDRIRLRIAGSVRLLRSDWNVDEIHAAHRNGTIDAGVECSRRDRFLVVFRGNVRAIGPRQFTLLRSLRDGATLGSLAERCADRDAGARVLESVRGFIADGWIGGFGVDDVFEE